MPTRELFATLIYEARLQARGARDFNRRLARECDQIRHDDLAGRRWSRRNYPGGYTSYGSQCRMHRRSPLFAELERRLAPHAARFARQLGFELRGRRLSMTDCWINIMGRHAVHGLHLHPLATLSGTYYVSAARGCPGLKFEDPRLDRMMAAPPRRAQGRRGSPLWLTVPARPGALVLFESWLRHEVAAHPGPGERVSISFNYGWF